jgi:hypothetical protein
MVLSDEANGLKSAIFIKGLLKKQTLFSTYYEANTPENQKQGEQLIDGVIYKTKPVPPKPSNDKSKPGAKQPV